MRRQILDSQTSLWKVGKATGSRWTGVTPKPARDPAGARPPGPPGPGQRSLEVGAPCKTNRHHLLLGSFPSLLSLKQQP